MRCYDRKERKRDWPNLHPQGISLICDAFPNERQLCQPIRQFSYRIQARIDVALFYTNSLRDNSTGWVKEEQNNAAYLSHVLIRLAEVAH